MEFLEIVPYKAEKLFWVGTRISGSMLPLKKHILKRQALFSETRSFSTVAQEKMWLD